MKHTRNKGNEMRKHLRMLAILLVPVVALILGAAVPELWAKGKPEIEELEEAEIFFELNNTDGDLGIHGKIDGGPWKRIWIKDSKNRTILNVSTKGRLKKQGLTELFFESAEPPFDKLDPEDFFERFPEGLYKIRGRSQDGKRLVGESEIRHVMPAPPDGIDVSGTEIDLEIVDCEEEAPEVIPEENGDVIISWAPVTLSHPGLGEEGDIEVARYQLVVEVELEVGGEEFESVFSIDLPPDVTSMTVPADFIALGLDGAEGEFKFEILVKEEEGGNQTATESCFAIVEEEEE